jgi:integrase
LSESDKRWIAFLQNRVGDLSLLPEIVDHWERTAKAVRNPLVVADLCTEYVKYRRTKSFGKSTLGDEKWVCTKFSEQFADLDAHKVTALNIREFLDTATSDSTGRKFYKVVSQMFDFGRERQVVVLNPCAEIMRPKIAFKEPAIITPAIFETLLRTAQAEFPTLLPYIVVAGFAGVRRDELIREYRSDKILRWEDFYWGRGLIEIRSEVAKKTARKRGDRRFIPIEPSLVQWLQNYRRKTGEVVALSDSGFRAKYRRLCQKAGHAPNPNELRHSFASFWLARSTETGAGALAKIMGNSEAVVKKHYVEVLSPEDGQAWFGIR